MPEFQIMKLEETEIKQYGLCGYKNPKSAPYQKNTAWAISEAKNGVTLFGAVAENDGLQALIEWMPGEHAWKPVKADGYLWIQCLFSGFKKQYKNLGIASQLIQKAVETAKEEDKNGIGVIVRKGSFMPDTAIFEKFEFKTVDQYPPDFKLMALELKENTEKPVFQVMKPEQKKGLYIYRCDQCPYTVNNVEQIAETAEKEYQLKPEIIEAETAEEARKIPSPFGVFCIVLDGEVIAEHMISRGRFRNIMKKKGYE